MLMCSLCRYFIAWGQKQSCITPQVFSVCIIIIIETLKTLILCLHSCRAVLGVLVWTWMSGTLHLMAHHIVPQWKTSSRKRRGRLAHLWTQRKLLRNLSLWTISCLGLLASFLLVCPAIVFQFFTLFFFATTANIPSHNATCILIKLKINQK